MNRAALIVLAVVLAAALDACGPRADPARPDRSGGGSAEPESDPATASETAPVVVTSETVPATSSSETAPADAAPEAAPAEGVGRVTDEGWVVAMGGMRFLLVGESFRVKKKGWGLRVTVTATSVDGEMHGLEDRLRLRGRIEDEAGLLGGFGEGMPGAIVPERVRPRASVTMTRDYPLDEDMDPIRRGEILLLEVGLQGLELGEATFVSPSLGVVRMEVPAKKGRPRITYEPSLP